MNSFRVFLSCILSLLLLYINTGVVLYKHTCNTSHQSFVGLTEDSCGALCCSDVVSCDIEKPCCNNDFLLYKFDYQTTIKFSNHNLQFIEIIDWQFKLNSTAFPVLLLGSTKKYLPLKSYFSYLQPDIHRLQVMRC